ncbi:Uncharacterized protein Adt_13403 [Abeliophyllum distichum]|uniref:Uncharacterized protein n=1 Tax=Abeliophyllum distichum TaxID=126358 RepID=A0ABD1TWQ5_9LAMI
MMRNSNSNGNSGGEWTMLTFQVTIPGQIGLGEQVHIKHKLVPSIILTENDEVSDTPKSQQKNQLNTNTWVHVHSMEAMKKITKSSKKKNARKSKFKRHSNKENKVRKRDVSTQEMVMLDDFKIFTDSLKEELRVARENIFTRMKGEVRKLVGSRSFFRPRKKDGKRSQKNEVRLQNEIESGVKSQNCYGALTGGYVKRKVASDANKFSEAVEEVENRDQVLAVTTTIKPHTDKRLSTKIPMTLVEDSNVIPKQQLRNHENGLLLNDHMKSGLARNKVEMGRSLNGENNQAFQPEEQFQSFSHFSSQRIGFPGQSCSKTSSVGVGFPVPLHQRLENGSSIIQQIYSKNPLQANSNVGPRMNHGITRFSMGSSALPKCFSANSISSLTNYKTDGDFVSMIAQDIGDGQFI